MGRMKDLFIAHPNCSEEIIIYQHRCTRHVEESSKYLRALHGMRERSEELLRLVREYQGKQGMFDVLLARLTNKPTKLDDFLVIVQEIANKQLQVLYDM